MQYYFVGLMFQNKLIIDQISHTNKHYDNYGCKTNLKECLLKENIFAYAMHCIYVACKSFIFKYQNSDVVNPFMK